MQLKRKLIAVVGVMVPLLVTFILLEIGLRIWGGVTPMPAGWQWENSPLRSLQPAAAATEVNALRLRGQAFSYTDADYVVLLVGDSQVEAAAVPFDQMPEKRLQQQLAAALQRPVKVFSLASSGWSQDQQYLAMQAYFEKHRADLVLVWLTPSNDFWENGFPERNMFWFAGALKPTFYLEGEKLKGPLYTQPRYAFGLHTVQMAFNASGYRFGQQFELLKWYLRMPAAATTPPYDHCPTPKTTEISFFGFLGAMEEILPDAAYTLTLEEDLEHTRGHFGQRVLPATKYTVYQQKVTQALYEKMAALATQHGAGLKMFYRKQHGYDRIFAQIKCVKTAKGYYTFQPKMLESVIARLVPAGHLLMVETPYGLENYVSKFDRHYSALGIARAMDDLAGKLVPHIRAASQDGTS